MNTLEQLLQADLHHLIDRIAASARPGMVADCAEHQSELARTLAEAESRLSATRQSLLDGYAAWREALDECGDLWALADLGSEPVAATERRAA